VWSVDDGKLRTLIAAHTNAISGLDVALNGRVIATANGQTVKLWSREDGALIRDLGDQTEGASFVKVTEDGRTLIAARSDGKVVALKNPFAPKLEIQFSRRELIATGIARQNYELQASTNLLDWTVVTNYTSDSSIVPFALGHSAADSTRYWRLLAR
jgi:WD40 repeat protein